MELLPRLNKHSLLTRNNHAQLSVFDMIIFAVLIMLASSIGLVAVDRTGSEQELSSDKNMMEQADCTLSVLLRTTLNFNEYKITADDPAQQEALRNINPDFRPISDIISEALYFRAAPTLPEQIDLNLLEKSIHSILTNLTLPHYGYRFEGKLENTEITFSSFNREGTQNPDVDYVIAHKMLEYNIQEDTIHLQFDLGLWRL